MTDLNPRYQLYADARLRGESQVAATIIAGYKESHAHVQSVRLERNANIQAYMRARQDAAAERVEVTVEGIIRELAAIAFASIRDVMSWTSETANLIPSADLTVGTAAAIKDVKFVTTRTSAGKDKEIERVETTIRMHDKLAALEKLGKQLGMFSDRVDHHVFVEEVRKLAREAGVDEADAVAEAERMLAQR
jgi:phage terminase small subunit